jgi:hypothetical protein
MNYPLSCRPAAASELRCRGISAAKLLCKTAPFGIKVDRCTDEANAESSYSLGISCSILLVEEK